MTAAKLFIQNLKSECEISIGEDIKKAASEGVSEH